MPDTAEFDVSIVIHASDAGEKLAGCVRAALESGGPEGQGNLSVQVVVVDDASTDDTASLAARIASAHPEVAVVSRLEAGRPVAAWLDGVRASKGAFALLLEAGDRLVEGGVDALVAFARQQGADVAGDLAETIRGQLVETHLLRRVLAELADADLGSAEDAAILFLLECFAENPVAVSGIEVAEVRLPEDPESFGPEEIGERCRARNAIAAIAGYLDRSEGWERHRRAFEAFALDLAARAIEPFPRAVEPADWAEVASLLLEHWGGPYVARILSEAAPDEQTVAALALGASERLGCSPAKVRRVLLCVGGEAEPELVERVHGSLLGQAGEVVVVADEHLALPDDLYQMVSLPVGLGVLPRCLALEAAIGECEPDAVVLVGDEPGATCWDALVARAAGLAVGLVSDWDGALDAGDDLAYDPRALLSRARDAALCTALALPSGTEAGPLRLLGLRVGTLGGLVSQLTLGAPRPMDLSDRLLAIRLFETGASLLATRDEDATRVAELEASVESLEATVVERDATIAELAPKPKKDAKPSPYVIEERKRPWFRGRRDQ